MPQPYRIGYIDTIAKPLTLQRQHFTENPVLPLLPFTIINLVKPRKISDRVKISNENKPVCNSIVVSNNHYKVSTILLRFAMQFL